MLVEEHANMRMVLIGAFFEMEGEGLTLNGILHFLKIAIVAVRLSK